MKQVGEILKKEREKQDLSLHEIGLSLKINTKILKALEDGDQAHLPAKTFLRGFVKSYAQYLKINPQEVLAAFDQEHKQVQQEKLSTSVSTSVHAQEKAITQMKPVEKTPFLKEFASSGKLTTVVVGAFLVILIIFVVQTMNKYQHEKMLAETTPALSTETPPSAEIKNSIQQDSALPSASPVLPAKVETAPLSTNTASNVTAPSTSSPAAASTITTSSATKANTESQTQHTPPAQPNPAGSSAAGHPVNPTKPTTTILANSVATSTTTTNKPPTASNSGTNASSVSVNKPSPAANPLSGQTATSATNTPQVNANSNPSTPTPPTKPKSSTVLVEALNNVVIRYVLDGKNESITLNPGQVHTFKGSKPGLVLEISDGGAVNMIVNGRDKGVPGEMGKPVKLTY